MRFALSAIDDLSDREEGRLAARFSYTNAYYHREPKLAALEM